MACKISKFMRPDWIISSLTATSKDDVLKEIALHLERKGAILDSADLARKFDEREQKSSTAADHGLAIPHATTDATDQLIVTLARSKAGIDFGAIDNQTSHLFFAIANPQRPPAGDATYLQVISSICRLMRSPSVRANLLLAKDEHEIYSLLIQEEEIRNRSA